MKNAIKSQLAAASFIEDQGLQYAYLISLFRYILQASAYSALEATAELVDTPEQFGDLSRKMLQPSDGDFIAILDLCIPALRNIWPACAPAWFDARNTKWSDAGRAIGLTIVAGRNDRIGHGVFDQKTLHDDLSELPAKISELAGILQDLIPKFDDNLSTGKAVLATPIRKVEIEEVRKKDGQLVLVRRIENRGSVWRIRGQILNHVNSPAVVIEISDSCQLLNELRSAGSKLAARNIQIGDDTWHTSVLLPLRQTQTFEGRGPEMESLAEWWADGDSRACLIYGEGGIGKTTLALEFLNDFLDNPPKSVEWRPELIFYYSAKLTRWGVSGLEQIGGINANVNEALRSLARILEPRLAADWHTEESRALVSKTATLFQSAGLNRNSILVILDNTETLARNVAEETGLNKIFREISTKIGKLIVTSRRRETFEAAHIQVLPMPEETGAKLLKNLGSAYSATSVNQAGDARLRKISRQFGGKPILLDVLVRHISHTNCGIDEGINTVLSQERGDLGAFLFEDAWNRMESGYRDVFFAIGQLGGSVSEQLLTWACAEFSCYAPNWLTAFEETRFGSLVDYGASFDITLDSGAREFLASKYSELDATEVHRLSSAVGRVRKKHQQVVSASEERITDRVLSAFRTNAAKAAKMAAARRDVDSAIKWYEEATVIDPANAALFDRYAWYLMVNERLDRAIIVAQKACELDSSDADAHFTYGMIAARRGNVADADKALDQARKLGKMTHLVKLQQARARLERAISLTQEHTAERRSLLVEAIGMLESATPSSRGGNHYKHERERDKLLARCHGLVSATTERTVLRKSS